ncbi:MAG: hypothetical protein A3F83_10950 [Candidatus Glassbacteria bacterium RIFCSPLOWO2_12_FULL_58_11]|uniref:Alginate export domain-containing protein n=1 Tax=Candidatus Glassbacteria bacterium RIFCSPLOWO2_12_FULL_58_11 TaxID=1817867 RepID=A0A1F5YPS5_9BACT|nr:MAG: hypothetical protein A3F83_10950 [Candidatus Glassbacteria bacterium RIFCSPLOWO2_12_FULL_58_11]
MLRVLENIETQFNRYSLLLLLLTTAAAESAFALADKNLEIHGFFLGNFTGRTTGLRPAGKEQSDFLLAEERVRLDLAAWSESIEASLKIKTDFFNDAQAGEFGLDLREAYLDLTTGDFDFRLGRQIATWGVGDLLFINDVFPKDWVSFFSGRPLEYLKIGVDGVRASYSSRALNAVLLVVPFFEPDNLPELDRFFLFDPFGAVLSRPEEKPSTAFDNTELALRLYRKIKGIDISGYFYKGFWRIPGIKPDNFVAPVSLMTFYPELYVYGLSAQGGAFGGVLSFETGYYYSNADNHGNDPAILNSQGRFLLGYQKQLQEDLTLGVQYYFELMKDYSAYKNSFPPGFPLQKKYRDTFTLRLEQLLDHQTLKLSLFSFYGLADDEYLIQPQMSYKFSDDLSASLGANIFGGEKETTFLGQYNKNDNVYLSARFEF